MFFGKSDTKILQEVMNVECRKFSPNIFNRSKCQNCFRGKDAHSTEALESNRATRKVTRCGYLFVAPDWDFSLPANRNKRWQRRWFVLYDDGELAYSVDEHPETVPQAVVDMTRVLEVCDAEGVTGNPFALALTAPDKVTFVKGTSREETAKWLEVLSKFPRNTVCGKYRRNATFPCGLKTDTAAGCVRRFDLKPFDPGDTPTRDTNHQEKKKQEHLSTIQNDNCIRPDEEDLRRSFGKKSEKPAWSSLHKSASVPNASLRDLTQVRGDPDGCNPDSTNDNTEVVGLKKGWLVRQEGSRWSKQWFVLRNCALTYFSDPLAEEAGVLDGFIDLRRANTVQQVDSARGFTFCIKMQDGSEVLLSAVTAKIRSQWLLALSPAPPPSPPLARTAISRVKARSRRRSSAPLQEHKGDVKGKVEEASWSIWLEVAKLCRQVEPPEGEAELARVEERLAKVQAELERARAALGIPHDQPPASFRGGGEVDRSEVRAAEAAADELELRCAGLLQAREQTERLHASQMALMAARVEDLTAKLLASERLVRQLRQRCAKLEQRRRSSLKGKEALTLSKEYEAKLLELEAKVSTLVGGGEVGEEGSLLARLAALDRRTQEAQQPPPPKIRLQVNADEGSSDEPSSVLEGLDHQVAALVDWLRPSLPPPLAALLQEEGEGGAIYTLALLTEVARHLRWADDQDAYRRCFLLHHVMRVDRCLEGLELYLQKGGGGVTLCEVAARLVLPPTGAGGEAEALLASAEGRRGRVAAALAAHRANALERLSAALRELGEGGEADHKHFLALVAHVVAQVAHTFEALVDRCYEESCWRGSLRVAVERSLSALSGEVSSLPSAALFSPSSARCAVLHEYLRCALADLARLVALTALAEEHLERLLREPPPPPPLHRPPGGDEWISEAGGGGAWLCDPGDLGVADRCVAGLLCFKRQWKERPCRCCRDLRQEVSYLQGELEESRVVARTGALCEKCRAIKEQLADKEQQFSEEMQRMEKELQTAKSNLKRLERHYADEVSGLQREYEVRLHQKNESLREDIRMRYAEEMEQLKAVCERGLSALDASHRRMLCELEQRHQRELEELAEDRERALAEEAKATALALEAVRKAHSEELQKQIQNFKDDFVVKMNKRLETEAFKKCYESDLSGIKQEIVSMSEKYSAKCLENATLSEKLEGMHQQLKATTTQVAELLAKNQQLASILP